jgi:polysaccharide deacetylase 2 family uncharacterized protein YibQ
VGRGFLSGIFWGGIVAVAVLFVSSQALERQSLSFPKPQASAVEVPGGSEFDQARPESEPVLPGVDERPAAESVAGVEVPEDAADAPPVLDNSALEVPVPATTQDAPDTLGAAPVESAAAPERPAAEDAAVTNNAAGELAAPEVPAQAPETQLAEPEAPEVEADADTAPEVAATEDAAVDGGETEFAALADNVDEPAAPEATGAPQVQGQVEAPDSLEAPTVEEGSWQDWLQRQEQSRIDQPPVAPRAPEFSSEPSLPAVGGTAPEAPAVEATVDEAVDEAVAEAMEAPDAPGTGEPEADAANALNEGESFFQPVETLDDSGDVVTDRLPQAGSGSELPVVRRLGDSDDAVPQEAEVVEADAGADSDDAAAAAEPEGPALTAFASAFEASGDMPLLSIVLVQQGGDALSPDVLGALPPYVAFAVDASDPSATEYARAYREAGREVVMIPSLPAGAAPQDIEQALAVNFERVPEAVAVMDVSGSSFQSDREAVAQVVAVAASSGHGLITFPRGLNTAHQEAQRAGVPTGLIFRNLDGEGETAEEIIRTLDRAAFRARQDEAVILVGTTGAATLSAIGEWMLGSRAEGVTIAPISAALGG